MKQHIDPGALDRVQRFLDEKLEAYKRDATNKAFESYLDLYDDREKDVEAAEKAAAKFLAVEYLRREFRQVIFANWPKSEPVEQAEPEPPEWVDAEAIVPPSDAPLFLLWRERRTKNLCVSIADYDKPQHKFFLMPFKAIRTDLSEVGDPVAFLPIEFPKPPK